MARDVEADLTINDKTGPGLKSAEERLRRTNKKIKDEGDKLNSNFAKSVVGLVENVSPKAAAALTRGFASAGEAGGPLLVAGAVAAAPLLAATVSAALIAGASVGAAGIGVAIVSQDARVQAAGKQLGESLMAGLQSDAAVFVQPVLDGIALIQHRFAESEGTIKSIFDHSAQFVGPLVDGATRFTQGILRGVDALVTNGRPVIDALSQGAAQLGNDLGEFMAQIAANGDDAARALNTVFNALSTILNITGPIISALTQVFGVLDHFGAIDQLLNSLIAGPFAAFLPVLDDTKSKTDQAATSAGGLAASFQKSADATKIQQEAAANLGPTMEQIKADIDAVTNANRALYGSNADVTLGLRDASKAIQDNAKHTKNKTIRDAENAQVLEHLAATLQTNYDNFVKVNGESAASIAKGDQLRASFIKTATGAGLSARAAQDLANKILGIPSKKVTDLHANTHDADARIRALQGQIDALHGKTVTVTVRQMTAAGEHVSGPGGSGTQLKYDARSTWSGGASGMSRTGGPATVSVDSKLYVSWDGGPYRAYAAQAVAESQRTAAHRQRVGTR